MSVLATDPDGGMLELLVAVDPEAELLSPSSDTSSDCGR